VSSRGPSQEETFNLVLQTAALRHRAGRPRDFAKESQALAQLAQLLSSGSEQIFQSLVDTVRTLCAAGSAGISLLERGTGGAPSYFRWRAMAGPYTRYAYVTWPADFSPCAVATESRQVHLMSEPARFYPYLGELAPPCFEMLLAPIFLDGEAVGALCAVQHEPNRHFDAGDERAVRTIASFASVGLKLSQALDPLEQHAPARTVQIASSSDSTTLKDDVLAMIAHELRNPLGPLRNAAYVLINGNFNLTVRRAASLIDRQVMHLNRLVDDLLDVTRIRLGRLSIDPVSVKLSDVVRMAVEGSQPSVESPSHHVRVNIAEEGSRVLGDPIRLTQVLQNLINNAAKYSDPRTTITISQRREGAALIVEVTDEGIGIAAEQIDSVFTLFSQADQVNSKRSREGLGIGLHLARQLVLAHRGTLTVTSDGPGRGSTFTVCLPSL